MHVSDLEKASLSPRQQLRIDFANREIDRYLDLWKHTDERRRGVVSLFLTLIGAIVPIAVLLDKILTRPRPFFIATIPFLMLLSLMGTLLGVNQDTAAIVKREYFLCTDVLRQVIVEIEPSLGPHLPYPARHRRSVTPDTLKLALQGSRTRAIVWLLIFGSAIPVGLTGGLLLWWAYPKISGYWLIATSGLLWMAGVAGGFLFHGYHRGRVLRNVQRRWFLDRSLGGEMTGLEGKEAGGGQGELEPE
jgi:hypothetical protein